MDLTKPAYLQTWHGVLNETDETASHPANVDLACMFIAFMQPRVIVEAGTYKGHFAFAAANILRQFGVGKVYTADPENKVAHSMEQGPQLAPFIQYHEGDFMDMMRDVPDPIDFGYIDASSKEDGHMRWNHASAVFLRLRPGGIIMVDDTAALDWDDAQRFRNWSPRSIHLPQHRGLTIIQKPL